MSNLFLHPDQIVKQGQYEDLLREAQHYHLIKATAQSRPNYLQKADATLRKMIAGLTRNVSSSKPMDRARI